MKRKKREVKSEKVYQYPPFRKNVEEQFIEEGCCEAEDKSIDDMDYDELCILRDELVESIMDIDTILEIELDSINPNVDSIRSDRKQRQRLVVEQREVKSRIKMIEKIRREENAA